MVTCNKRDNVVGGLFKIRGEDAGIVLDYVINWKRGEDGHRFESLCVRDCTGRTQRDFMVAIEFLYVLGSEDIKDDDALRAHNLFFHKYTDMLRRRFGNGLAVWDISTPVYEIAD